MTLLPRKPAAVHTITTASLPALVLLAAAAPFAAAQPASLSNFSNFTPLAASVPAVALPPETPFQFGNASWTQLSIADRATQLTGGQFNTGAWDMIDVNRSGPDAGRYVFTVFETSQSGIQRTDRITGATVTLWAAPAPGSALAFDPSLWTPWGTVLTAEEAWGQQPMPCGRLFELTNPVSATGTKGADAGNLLQRNAVARVRHEGLAFDSADNLAIDADGNIYIVEDRADGTNNIWFAADADRDGVAESLSR